MSPGRAGPTPGTKEEQMNIAEIKTAAQAAEVVRRFDAGQSRPEDLLGAARFYISVAAPRRSREDRAWKDACKGLWLATEALGEELVPRAGELAVDGWTLARRAREWFAAAIERGEEWNPAGIQPERRGGE